MTYREAIYNLKQAKSVPYRKATFIKVNELLDELEQDKPTVEIDLYSVIKQKYIEREVLDKIDEVIADALDKSTDQKESQTLRWVLDKISEVTEWN